MLSIPPGPRQQQKVRKYPESTGPDVSAHIIKHRDLVPSNLPGNPHHTTDEVMLDTCRGARLVQSKQSVLCCELIHAGARGAQYQSDSVREVRRSAVEP
jgi:deoxycytidylate deaminase